MDSILKELIILRDGLQTTGHEYWGEKASKITEMYKYQYSQEEPIN